MKNWNTIRKAAHLRRLPAWKKLEIWLLCQEKRMTLNGLAQMLGEDQSTLRKVVRGEKTSRPMCEKLEELTGIDFNSGDVAKAQRRGD